MKGLVNRLSCAECIQGSDLGRPVELTLPNFARWVRENLVGRHAHLFLDAQGRLHLHRCLISDSENTPQSSPLLSLRIGGFWRSSKLDGKACTYWDVCDDWDWSFGFVDRQGLILPVTDITTALQIIQKFNSVEEFLSTAFDKLNSPVTQAMEIVQVKFLQDKLSSCENLLKQSEEIAANQKQELDLLRTKFKIAESITKERFDFQQKQKMELETVIADLEHKVRGFKDELAVRDIESLDLMDKNNSLAGRVKNLEEEIYFVNNQLHKKKSQLEKIYRKVHVCIKYIQQSMARSRFQSKLLDYLK